MGRPRSNIDTEKMLDLLEQGWGHTQIASELGISKPTLATRITELQGKQDLVLKYRALQSIQLTSLQARILDAVTDEKIDEAPLHDLIGAYKILKDRELVLEGKPSEIKGLVSYLVEIEKREIAGKVDVTVSDTTGVSSPSDKPKLEGLGSFNASDLVLGKEDYLS